MNAVELVGYRDHEACDPREETNICSAKCTKYKHTVEQQCADGNRPFIDASVEYSCWPPDKISLLSTNYKAVELLCGV